MITKEQGDSMTEALMNRMRWKIEEMHKHVKQAYQWEMIQLSSYTRLQNMNQILLLTMCFLYSLKSFAASYLQAFPNIMAYTNQDWKKILGFIYYKLTMLLNQCFSLVTRRKIKPYTGDARCSRPDLYTYHRFR
jgi:hypothetical protein